MHLSCTNVTVETNFLAHVYCFSNFLLTVWTFLLHDSLSLSLFSLSVSRSVIGCWWLGWGHVPKEERRLPIGLLSAHVTAATVHVLSRVSPITLALFSFIHLYHCLVPSRDPRALFSPYPLLFFPASLLCSTTSRLFPSFPYPSLFLMFCRHLSPSPPPPA